MTGPEKQQMNSQSECTRSLSPLLPPLSITLLGLGLLIPPLSPHPSVLLSPSAHQWQNSDGIQRNCSPLEKKKTTNTQRHKRINWIVSVSWLPFLHDCMRYHKQRDPGCPSSRSAIIHYRQHPHLSRVTAPRGFDFGQAEVRGKQPENSLISQHTNVC